MTEKTVWEKYKEKNGSTPLDMLNPNTRRLPSEASKVRLDICKSCPELTKITMQCKKCGCFMVAKTKLEISKCPIGKW
jgi:hypothetical protein